MLQQTRHTIGQIWATIRSGGKVAMLLLAGGIALHVIFFVAIPLKHTPPKPIPEQRPFVRVVSAEAAEVVAQALQEQSLLLDSAPLFLPTRLNHSQTPVSLPIPDPSPLFKDYAPRITLNADTLLPPSPLESEAVETLRQTAEDSLLATELTAPFQIWQEPPPLPIRPAVGVCEIRDAGTGELLLLLQWPESILSHPVAGELRQPAQFQLVVQHRSHAAQPLVIRGTGSENLDLLLVQFLQRPEIAAQLPNGYYTVLAGG